MLSAGALRKTPVELRGNKTRGELHAVAICPLNVSTADFLRIAYEPLSADAY